MFDSKAVCNLFPSVLSMCPNTKTVISALFFLYVTPHVKNPTAIIVTYLIINSLCRKIMKLWVPPIPGAYRDHWWSNDSVLRSAFRSSESPPKAMYSKNCIFYSKLLCALYQVSNGEGKHREEHRMAPRNANIWAFGRAFDNFLKTWQWQTLLTITYKKSISATLGFEPDIQMDSRGTLSSTTPINLNKPL